MKKIYEDLKKKTKSLINYLPKEKKEKVLKAFDFAWEAHKEQIRKSGEPYFIHLFETAKTLMELRLDEDVVSAGFLHDSVEDVDVSLEEIEKEFGKDVAFLVDGVTKLGTVRYHGLKRHNESLKKLFIAVAEDLRVILIKFADRLHNIKTLEFVKPEKRLRIATETLDIYAPLANRLGITKIARQLEDYSFKYVLPDEYKKVIEIVKNKKESNLSELKKISRMIIKKVTENGIQNFKSSYTRKGLYYFYKKNIEYKNKGEKNNNISFSVLKIITNDEIECYKIMGIIHKYYRPVPNRIKDYIATPKPNGYKSLHTTVFIGDGSILEIQIKTEEMWMVDEYGLVYFYNNSDLRKISRLFKKSKEWIKEMADEAKTIDENIDEKIETKLSDDFLTHRIFVFTPTGDVIDMPFDSTVTDFAFAVHTDLGMHIVGAKVNGDFKSIDTKLKEGDIVEIQTKENSWPTKKWLEFVKTTLAKKKIRAYLEKNK